MTEGQQLLGTGKVRCPHCGASVPFDVLAGIIRDDDGQILQLEPDLTDVWAHAFTHEDTPT